MRSALADVVQLGGLALQAEDCSIRAAVRHRNEFGGLVRLENERHHQFIIWRAVLPIWHAELERDYLTDLVVERNGERHHFEMKDWRSGNGMRELPSIRADIKKLRTRDRGYILITSNNPPGHLEQNIRFFFANIDGLDQDAEERYVFTTHNQAGLPWEYWLAGWPVQKLHSD